MSLKFNVAINASVIINSKKHTRQCKISNLAGPVPGKAVHFVYLNYRLLFQFVVSGGIGCLSYKHPKKMTVSIQ